MYMLKNLIPNPAQYRIVHSTALRHPGNSNAVYLSAEVRRLDFQRQQGRFSESLGPV